MPGFITDDPRPSIRAAQRSDYGIIRLDTDALDAISSGIAIRYK